MHQKRPVRHTRPASLEPQPRRYDRRQANSPLIQRNHIRSFRRRQKRKQWPVYVLTAAAVLLLCTILALLIFPGKQTTIPVDAQQHSSELQPQPSLLPPNSSDIASQVNAGWEHAYQTALQIKLVNFDHPNYEDPDVLISLEGLLPKSVTINAGATLLAEPAAHALKELFEAAEADGITTFIVNSAYRDRATQQSFWDNRIAQDPSYGDDVYANPVKTVPATASEHCTGLAVDILCDSVPHGTADYKDTQEAQWLAANAHLYGFILRYPEGKQSVTGVMFEPWHYRYVGKEAASDIYASGLCLEEYLASFHLPLEESDS